MGRFSNRARGYLLALAGAGFVVWTAAACRTADTRADQQLPPLESAAAGPSVRMFREVLSFKIGGGRVEGQGFYYFRNTDSVTRAFPAAIQFFVNNWQGLPKNLKLAQILPETDNDIPYVWLDKSCSLTQILVPPDGNYCLQVDWEQPLAARRFVYVLRREPPWNRRRELLRVTILVPPHYRNVRINNRPSFKFKTDQHRSFVIVREDFEPPEDLVVTWDE